jgi:hypothetical protein
LYIYDKNLPPGYGDKDEYYPDFGRETFLYAMLELICLWITIQITEAKTGFDIKIDEFRKKRRQILKALSD